MARLRTDDRSRFGFPVSCVAGVVTYDDAGFCEVTEEQATILLRDDENIFTLDQFDSEKKITLLTDEEVNQALSNKGYYANITKSLTAEGRKALLLQTTREGNEAPATTPTTEPAIKPARPSRSKN